MDPDSNFSVVPSVPSEEILFKPLSTLFNISTTETITESPAKLNGGEFMASQRSVRVRLHFGSSTNF
jgi:hypothetical protein